MDRNQDTGNKSLNSELPISLKKPQRLWHGATDTVIDDAPEGEIRNSDRTESRCGYWQGTARTIKEASGRGLSR